MFDHAFGYPHHLPWTVGDLECRLEAIHELLSPAHPTLDTPDAIFEGLASLSDSPSPPSVEASGAQRDILVEASKAFCEAKKYFMERMRNCSWSDGYCTWIASSSIGPTEYRHDDVLIYQSFTRNKSTSYSVIITCLAELSDDRNAITLSVSSSVNGKTIRIPLAERATTSPSPINIRESFNVEVKNLLLAVYKERRTLQS